MTRAPRIGNSSGSDLRGSLVGTGHFPSLQVVKSFMTPHKKRPCPVARRLAEEMTIRNLAPFSIDAYGCHAWRFADCI